MRKLLKKSNCSAGFTLAETLIAVVILVLISAAALPAAMNAYRNAVDAANAQVLLSTTVNALRDELSTAWNVSVDGTTITYQSAATGDMSVISLMAIAEDRTLTQLSGGSTDQETTIALQEYSKDETQGWWDGDIEETTALPRPLVSDAMRRTTRNSNNFMTVKYTGASSVKSADGKYIEYIKIDGLAVERDNKVLAKMPDAGLLIRVMGAESAAATDDTGD